MIVGCIGNREVLCLVQEVICSECESRGLIEKKLCDLCIEDEFWFLLSCIPVVPVIIKVADDIHSERKCPVHFK